jgi:hypothetical protein
MVQGASAPTCLCTKRLPDVLQSMAVLLHKGSIAELCGPCSLCWHAHAITAAGPLVAVQVSKLCYYDGKAFGLAFMHSAINMWTVDLTQVQPFGQPRRLASSLDRRRLSAFAVCPARPCPCM